jgi:hypothetical protein
VRFPERAEPEIFVSGPGIVGLAFAPSGDLVASTHNALYRLELDLPGRPLF